MQDAIIKGTGNSRYLKSVANFMALYPTYEDFVDALVSGTLPVDFNGINANGWTQQGTPMNKANVLTDATAALLGLTSAATPNDAFSKLSNATPISRGGTGQTTAAKALYALINGATALDASNISGNDIIGLGDTSESTGKKITVDSFTGKLDLLGYSKSAFGSVQNAGSYPNRVINISVDFYPCFVIGYFVGTSSNTTTILANRFNDAKKGVLIDASTSGVTIRDIATTFGDTSFSATNQSFTGYCSYFVIGT